MFELELEGQVGLSWFKTAFQLRHGRHKAVMTEDDSFGVGK